jgi:hypothetical protein
MGLGSLRRFDSRRAPAPPARQLRRSPCGGPAAGLDVARDAGPPDIKRLHAALGYLSPIQHEEAQTRPPVKSVA